MPWIVHLTILAVLLSTPAFADLGALSACEAELLHGQQGSPTQSLVTANAKDAVYALQRFRAGLASKNETPVLLHALRVASETASQVEYDLVAGEIAGIEAQFFNPEVRVNSGDAPVVLGLTRKGSEQVLRYFYEVEDVRDKVENALGAYDSKIPLTPADSLFTELRDFLLIETMIGGIPRTAIDRASIAGKWYFTTRTYQLRRATVDAIIRGNGKIDFPFVEEEITIEAWARSHDFFAKFVILATSLLRPNPLRNFMAVASYLYKNVWVRVDHLVIFDQAGVPTLTAVIRTSKSKPVGRSAPKQQKRNDEIEWTPVLVPVPAVLNLNTHL